jgi:hypothetical protein
MYGISRAVTAPARGASKHDDCPRDPNGSQRLMHVAKKRYASDWIALMINVHVGTRDGVA